MKEVGNIAKIILSLANDEDKIEYVDILNDESEKYQVIASLKDDSIKYELLNKIKDETGKSIIIASINNDDFKHEQLPTFQNEQNRVTIIKSINNDEAKIGYLPTIKSTMGRAEIIASLYDDNRKMELQNQISNELKEKHNNMVYTHREGIGGVYKRPVIYNESDKVAFDEIVEITKSLSNDEEKIDLIGCVLREGFDYYLYNLTARTMITTLHGEIEEKISKASKLIRSLSNDDIKSEMIKKYKLYKDVCSIKSISNDDIKMEFIEIIKNENKKYERYPGQNEQQQQNIISAIISSLSDDNKKLEYLGTVNDRKTKLKIIVSLRDDNKKIDFLNDARDEKETTAILASLNGDAKKIEYLNGLNEVIAEKENTKLYNLSIDELQKMEQEQDDEIAKLNEEINLIQERQKQELLERIKLKMELAQQKREERDRLLGKKN